MLSDIEIAQAAEMKPITEIAAQLGLQSEDVIPYGHYKAKINHKLAKRDKPEGKLILMTAISPTPAGASQTVPFCRTFWVRSASSTYMKYAGSNPPISLNTSVRTAIKLPVQNAMRRGTVKSSSCIV